MDACGREKKCQKVRGGCPSHQQGWGAYARRGQELTGLFGTKSGGQRRKNRDRPKWEKAFTYGAEVGSYQRKVSKEKGVRLPNGGWYTKTVLGGKKEWVLEREKGNTTLKKKKTWTPKKRPPPRGKKKKRVSQSTHGTG